MGQAKDIIDALNSIGFDKKGFLKEVATFLIDRVSKEINLDETFEMILYKFEDKIKSWMVTLISSLTPETANALLMAAIRDEVEKWLEENDLEKMIEEWLEDEEPAPPPPPPPPPPQPKIKMFAPGDNPSLLWDGHDNAPVTVSESGWIYTVTGDGPVNGVKHESCLWKCGPGKDPMVTTNWEFIKGYRGKCYGLICIGEILYLFISDKGSNWEGMQNCRRLEVFTDQRSGRPFQYLHQDGANWFAVQYGPGNKYSPYPLYTIIIGCVSFAGHGHGQHQANYKTPIRLWKGDIRDIASFKEIGIAAGINGPRNNWTTTMSISYIASTQQYVSGGGDWTASEVYQCITQSENVKGPYKTVHRDAFSPPMAHDSYKDGTRWTGVFTKCFFEDIKGDWYRMLSGHNPNPLNDRKQNKDDSVYCQKVKMIR